MRRVLLSIVVAACWSIQTFAWNPFGHEMVAYIAWQQMTPEQRQHYSEILKAMPHYAQELDEPAGPDHDMHAFMKAATWPDLIRSPQFPDEAGDSHPTWHYIDEPINPTHMPATQPVVRPGTTQPTNALEALAQETRILNDSSADPVARAKALCWVLHLVGDLHQPLHCVSLFDNDFPGGDHGGNSIRLRSSDVGRNLHALWDNILGQHGDLEAVARTANESTQQYAGDLAKQAQDIDAQDWVQEGQKLAVSVVYEGLELNGAGELLTDVNRTSVSPDRNYLRRARDTARRQVVLAGHRLARYLK
jgi:hypothetical protein